tara:strand:+ start:941 stop:1420 length:480 start_codon:yes stop_codon:yes gene_type:complete
MDDNLREKLKEMVKSYKSEETTNNIRDEKNSRKIHNDVQKILNLKSKYARLQKSNFSQFRKMAINKCNFLFTNFTNIFNRLLKDELDLKILFNMIQVLEKIENHEVDQHEGSAMIGLILKKLYIDPVIKNKKKLKKPPNAKSNISWNDFKKSNVYKNNI